MVSASGACGAQSALGVSFDSSLATTPPWRSREWFTNALDDHLAALVGLPVPVRLAVILKL